MTASAGLNLPCRIEDTLAALWARSATQTHKGSTFAAAKRRTRAHCFHRSWVNESSRRSWGCSQCQGFATSGAANHSEGSFQGVQDSHAKSTSLPPNG